MISEHDKHEKSHTRLTINLYLLSVCFTIFALIISLNPSLFQEYPLVPLELTAAIPLFLASIFARSKLPYTKKPYMRDIYGFMTFIIGYSCLINVTGILLAAKIGVHFWLIFFGFCIATALTYSALEIVENSRAFSTRKQKDAVFILLVILGGVLPILGLY